MAKKKTAARDAEIKLPSLAKAQLFMLVAGWRSAANRLALSLRRMEHGGRVKALAEMKALRRCAKTLEELIEQPQPGKE